MAPKTKEQFEKIRHRSQQTIKEVALELFARYGYHSTSISQIAKEAGVSKGLMYNYFESKEALLQAIIMDAIDISEEVLQAQFSSEKDARQRLRELTLASIRMVQSNRQYWKLLTALALQPDVFRGMEGIFNQKKEETMAGLIGLFAETGVAQPKQEAYFFGAVLDGVILHYLQWTGDDYPIDEMVDYTLRRLNID